MCCIMHVQGPALGFCKIPEYGLEYVRGHRQELQEGPTGQCQFEARAPVPGSFNARRRGCAKGCNDVGEGFAHGQDGASGRSGAGEARYNRLAVTVGRVQGGGQGAAAGTPGLAEAPILQG